MPPIYPTGQPVVIVDVNGNPTTVTGGSAGVQYAAGATQATPTGTVALGINGTTLKAVQTDASGNLVVSGTGTFAVSATALPLPAGASTSAKQPALGVAGTASVDVITVQGITSMTALKVDGSGVTQPISDTNLVAQGSTTATQNGRLVQGAVTTGAPTYTTAQTSPLSLTTGGALRVDASATTQPANITQIAGSAVSATVAGIQNVVGISGRRNGATVLSCNFNSYHITTSTTTTPLSATAFLTSVGICVSSAGTTWSIVIKNKEATAKTLYTVASAAVGTTVFTFNDPIAMVSGIDIVTTGATPGVVDVFLTWWS